MSGKNGIIAYWLRNYIREHFFRPRCLWPLDVSSGLQSPGATRSTERHDKGWFHGKTQSLVLLHHSRAGSLWDKSDLGVQSGPADEHCHPHAGHRQVISCLLVDWCVKISTLKWVVFPPFIFSGAHLCSAVIWPKMRLPSPTPHLMANSLLRSTVTRQRSLFTTLLREVVKKIKVPYYICFNIFLIVENVFGADSS